MFQEVIKIPYIKNNVKFYSSFKNKNIIIDDILKTSY